MKRIATFLMALVMVFSVAVVPASAKTIKTSDTKTAKKQIQIMVNDLTNPVNEIINTKLKYNKSKTYDFHKKSDRHFFASCININDGNGNLLTINKNSRWFFGNSDVNKEVAPYDWGVDYTKQKITKITKSGQYYTVKTKVMYSHYSEKISDYKKAVQIGTVTYTFKLRSNTHYGLLVKKAVVKRTRKASWTKD